MTGQTGRPRSRTAEQAILRAAYDALVEVGLERTSIEDIARRAGSSKATIYRWWPSKAAVILDAVGDLTDGYPTFRHSGDTRQDLLDELRGVIRFYDTVAGQAMLDLVAGSRTDPDLASQLRDRFISGRRRDTREVLEAGVAAGQVRADLDPEPVMDAIWGAVYYKLLVSHTPPEPDYADLLIDTFWPALAA